MGARYFLPQNDITTQELATIMGFVTIGLVNNIEQRKEEILNRKQEDYPCIRIADRSLNSNKTFILSEDIYNTMPITLRRHFSAY